MFAIINAFNFKCRNLCEMHVSNYNTALIQLHRFLQFYSLGNGCMVFQQDRKHEKY